MDCVTVVHTFDFVSRVVCGIEPNTFIALKLLHREVLK